MSAPTEKEVDRIVAGQNAAIDSADFVDTVIFEPQQIEGNRYKYIFTNAPDPRE